MSKKEEDYKTLRNEIELIKEVFSNAIRAKESKGGQHVPYFGDFASIGPSTTSQMKRWIDRWNKVLKSTKDSYSSSSWYTCAKCDAGYEDQECTCDDLEKDGLGSTIK